MTNLKTVLNASKAKRSRTSLVQSEKRSQLKLQTMVFAKTKELRSANKALKREIMDRKRAEEKLREMEKAKNEFVSVASHEFRTPLTIVNGYLSLLLNGDLGTFEGIQGQGNLARILGKIYKETQRLNNLAEELLNVSRIEAGKIRLHLSQIYVADMIAEVLSELQTLAEEKKITLKIQSRDVTNSPLEVKADEDKLKQVLVNLIDNAIKFTPSDGLVIIKCFRASGQVVIQVRDTGIGISQAILPRIFEKFQQGSGTYVKENKGTGLGLFIVKSLVSLHHGKISVESKVGQGSTFTFSLPVAPN